MTDLNLLLLVSPNQTDQANYLAQGLAEAGYHRLARLPYEPGPAWLDQLARLQTDLIIPLVQPADGNLPGALEFLGRAHTGASLTASLLTHRPLYAAGILGVQGLDYRLRNATPLGRLAVVGDEAPRLGRPCWTEGQTGSETAVADLALAAHQALHQTGWGLYSFGHVAGRLCLLGIDSQPDLAPTSPFRQSLSAAGLNFAQAVTDYLHAGLARFQQEADLRFDYKDRV